MLYLIMIHVSRTSMFKSVYNWQLACGIRTSLTDKLHHQFYSREMVLCQIIDRYTARLSFKNMSPSKICLRNSSPHRRSSHNYDVITEYHLLYITGQIASSDIFPQDKKEMDGPKGGKERGLEDSCFVLSGNWIISLGGVHKVDIVSCF